MTLVFDNLPAAVSEALEKKARDEGRTVEQVALEALTRGLENDLPKRDLSDVRGTWVEDPEFNRAMEDFERIDEDPVK
jgi:hypothetical protein